MKAEKLKEHWRPLNSERVKVKNCGNITEILYQSTTSKGGIIRKISKDEYVNINTGEVNDFVHIENRSQDLKSISKSLALGRDILNTNITDVSCCRWITLTYGENMTEPKKLLNDFKNFNKRLRQEVGHYEYITAAEPQGRGAWHLHVVMIFKDKAPFIPNELVSSCWKQGFVTVKRLDDVDNVGAYLTAYLGDLELSEAQSEGINIKGKEVKLVEYEEDGKQKSKRYIKGARLSMYPPQFHIFRYSKGIRKPEITIEREEKAKQKVKEALLTYEKTVKLSDEENFCIYLNYRYYNKKRVTT